MEWRAEEAFVGLRSAPQAAGALLGWYLLLRRQSKGARGGRDSPRKREGRKKGTKHLGGVRSGRPEGCGLLMLILLVSCVLAAQRGQWRVRGKTNVLARKREKGRDHGDDEGRNGAGGRGRRRDERRRDAEEGDEEEEQDGGCSCRGGEESGA